MRRFLLLWVSFAVVCCAGAPKTEFEVASLRQSQTQIGKDSDSQVKFGAAGVTARNVTLKQLIQTAYGLQPHQVSGGPRWLDETEYDLEARAAGAASPEQLRAMLQSLLADRFHLAAHKETKQMRVYALVQDTGGAKIHSVSEAAPAGKTDFRGDMTRFANFLSLRLTIPAAVDPSLPSVAGGPQTPVVDKTGLAGIFEIDLNRNAELGVDGFTLLQRRLKDLGLKLESRSERMELLLVEAAEKPRAD